MKKLLLFASFVFLISFQSFCQGQADTAKHEKKHSFAITGGVGPAKKKKIKDTTRHFVVGFNDGYGIPVGPFRKADINKYPNSRFNGQDTTRLAGYALYGFHYEYYISYQFSNKIGIMLLLGGNQIGYDINAMNSQFQQFWPPNLYAVTSGDSYYILQYLIGPTGSFRLGKKGFRLEYKALVGYTTTNFPTLSYIGFPKSETYSFPKGTGIGYSVGMGIKYTMVEGHIGVHANISYAVSTVNFSGYDVAFYTPPNNSNPNTANIFLYAQNYNYPKTLDINLVQVTLGISGEF